MFYRWKTKNKRDRFYRLTGGILNTPPIVLREAPWSIISMVSNQDVQMYLLSMKSFYSRLGAGSLTVIVDRDMPEASRGMLREHFLGINFTHLEDIDPGVCQRGGTWERLVYLIDRSKDEYVIQLDCDTLAFGPDIEEVKIFLANNIPFSLGGEVDKPIDTMASFMADALQQRDVNHIIFEAERCFAGYPGAQKMKYARASSGFVGLPKGAFSRAQIEEFHENMSKLLGPRWREWGSEQVGSNFAVANSPGARLLPLPKYANFTPSLDRSSSSFLHFIGTYRYMDDYFATRGQQVIRELMPAAGSEGVSYRH